jgi:hypothetical protein
MSAAGDCRTTHGATPGLRSATRDATAEAALFRAVAYVTYAPRSAATPEVQRDMLKTRHPLRLN